MLLWRGAEAELYREGPVLNKKRVRKKYRIRALDTALRKKRTRRESKLLREVRRVGVKTPRILEEGEFYIKMEFIEGDKLKDLISNIGSGKKKELALEIGKNIAKLHENNIVHGDLTTSNMLNTPEGIYFIDFGLGEFNKNIEAKAVDLRLLYEVIISTHYKFSGELWDNILKGYENFKDCEKVVKRLKDIEKRGRYS